MRNLYAVVLMALMVACNSSEKEDVRTSITGTYKYTVINDADGEEAEDGEIIVINVKATDNNDSVWVDRPEIPFKKDTAKWNNGQEGFWEILYNVSAGDSLTFNITAAEFLMLPEGAPMPPFAMGVDSFSVNVGIKEIMDYEAYVDYVKAQEEERLKTEMGDEYISPEQQADTDEANIQKYLEENNIEATRLDNGIYLALTEKGDGPKPQSGDTVLANYTGYLLDGSYFDSSVETVAQEKGIIVPGRQYEPFEFVIDESQVIKGWHESFKEMNVGSKGTVYIPSNLGWGRRGSGPKIPPNAVTAFDIELLEIK